jgi:deazaflavin-dependent oxidoreductase (nitroreductase family)
MAAVRRSKLMELLWRVHPRLYRATGGRFGGRMVGNDILLLTTRGRKTREPRTVALSYFSDGDAYVVVASYAGQPKHPGWWLNLEANPEATIELGSNVMRVRAHEAGGDERERLWTMICERESGYKVYESRTTRKIPVVVLDPA